VTVAQQDEAVPDPEGGQGQGNGIHPDYLAIKPNPSPHYALLSLLLRLIVALVKNKLDINYFQTPFL